MGFAAAAEAADFAWGQSPLCGNGHNAYAPKKICGVFAFRKGLFSGKPRGLSGGNPLCGAILIR